MAIAAASAFAALTGVFWGFGLTCDDSCSGAPPWRDDPEAWQWDAFGWVSVAGFASALGFLVSVARGSRSFALGALVVWAVLGCVWTILLRDSGLTSNAARGWSALAVLVLAGIAATALTRRRSPRERTGGTDSTGTAPS